MKYILILLMLFVLSGCTPEPEPEQNTPATETGDPNDPGDDEPNVGGWGPGSSGETPAEPE